MTHKEEKACFLVRLSDTDQRICLTTTVFCRQFGKQEVSYSNVYSRTEIDDVSEIYLET